MFDEKNDTYEDKQYYTWEELIADDIRDIKEFNNTLHPNQKKYTGMTRWQVLEANMNPTLQPMDKSVWARFIGEHTETSIRRNSYCRVAYKDWWLSKTEVMERLDPNNYKVDAYYLTDEDGNATDVISSRTTALSTSSRTWARSTRPMRSRLTRTKRYS